MPLNIESTATLHNGVEMPWLGLGVFKAEDGEEVINAIHAALDQGYRHIDTAKVYENEEGVGKAIRESSVPRDQIFVTTKLWNEDIRNREVESACDASLKRLGLDEVDLYLIHWPVEPLVETWQNMEKLLTAGKTRAIGVSNYHVHHLESLLPHCEVSPMVNQVEFHPRLSHVELRQFCKDKLIQFEAWSPIMKGRADEVDVLRELGEKYGKTAVQIVLRWDLQHEVVTIPKSVKPHRIEENANIFDFELSDEDMARIDGLNTNDRLGPDPDNFSF